MTKKRMLQSTTSLYCTTLTEADPRLWYTMAANFNKDNMFPILPMLIEMDSAKYDPLP